MATWTGLVREVGQSVVDLLRAELADVSADLGRSGQRLGKGLALAGLALVLAFWALGLLLALLVMLLALVLPVWAAAAIVLVVFVLGAWLALALAQRDFAAVENPALTVRRHLDDHLAWWQSRLATLEAEATAASTEASGSGPTAADYGLPVGSSMGMGSGRPVGMEEDDL
jgi:uncharacterized membrane protein YqjE